MYSVGCENSACSIQSGIDPQPAVFLAYHHYSSLGPGDECRDRQCGTRRVRAVLHMHWKFQFIFQRIQSTFVPPETTKLSSPTLRQILFCSFSSMFFFCEVFLWYDWAHSFFLQPRKLWKVYQLIWINNSQFICCLETGCFVCAISGFVISHEIFCSNVCDYKQPLQPWELVKTLHIF